MCDFFESGISNSKSGAARNPTAGIQKKVVWVDGFSFSKGVFSGSKCWVSEVYPPVKYQCVASWKILKKPPISPERNLHNWWKYSTSSSSSSSSLHISGPFQTCLFFFLSIPSSTHSRKLTGKFGTLPVVSPLPVWETSGPCLWLRNSWGISWVYLPETSTSHTKITPWKFGDSELGNHHLLG